MIRLFYHKIGDAYNEEELFSLFPAFVKEKFVHLKSPKYKKEFLAARWLLLESVTKAGFSVGLLKKYQVLSSEKPVISGRPFYFSLSHSGAYVFCAVSSNEIGLDVEEVNVKRERLITRYFTEAEKQFVGTDFGKFLEIWTKKESYIKYSSLRLADMSSFDVIRLEEEKAFEFYHNVSQGMSCSVCAKKIGGDIIEWERV